MMAELFKGMPMFKNLVVLIFAALLLPAGAQSQGQSGAKAQAHRSSAQAKFRAEADITARLQAQAIAEAAAQAAALAKESQPLSVHVPADSAPANVASAFSSPPRSTDAQAFAPMQPLPGWTEVQPSRNELLATPSLAAVPSTTNAPAVVAVPPLSPVAAGWAATDSVAQSASDPMAQELAIAQQIHLGLMPCEMGASVRVEADVAVPGYFHVQGKGFRYRMYPVRTSTGALRLEDKRAGAVWLQLANKSMLMDQKKGRRVADECAHPAQVAYGQDMKTNPPPSLFDKTGMGRSND